MCWGPDGGVLRSLRCFWTGERNHVVGQQIRFFNEDIGNLKESSCELLAEVQIQDFVFGITHDSSTVNK